MRICHLINCLSVGGTERQLIGLVAARSVGIDASIVTLLDRDTLREQAAAAGARVRSLGLSAARPTPIALMRLAAIVREEKPDVVQSWLYYANAAATLVRPLAGGRWPLAWNLRQTVESLDAEGRALRLAFRLNRWLSRRPEVVVSNSSRALDDHRRMGFRPRREVVIPNGLDLAGLAHGRAARTAARRAIGLRENDLAVGIAGRDHPHKDHLGFMEAMALVDRSLPPADGERLRMVMIGRGVARDHARIPAAIERLGLGGRVLLLGQRLDLPSLYAAFDCFVSSSSTMEAFPNVVAEAMAAQVPVVATDVGECREIVGDAGRVVPPRDPAALAGAISSMLLLDQATRSQLGELGRARVQERYDMRQIARRYEQLWRELIASA